MKSKLAVLGIASAIFLTAGQLRQASADSFDGSVNGTELVTQAIGGKAVFIFRFSGEIDGRRRTGIGIVGFNHTPLPDTMDGYAEILHGEGTIYVGFRRYAISQVSGTITVKPDGPFLWIFPLQFDVDAQLLIKNTAHRFQGVLHHDTLPFSLTGQLSSDP